MSNAKLFCRSCHEELSLKANVLKNHLRSEKHQAGKTKLEGKEAREHDIAVALEKHNERNHLEGETLSMDQQVYRITVLTAFLKAGIPLHKLLCFRSLLEKNGIWLTDRSHMANLIPFVLENEVAQVKLELSTKDVSIMNNSAGGGVGGGCTLFR